MSGQTQAIVVQAGVLPGWLALGLFVWAFSGKSLTEDGFVCSGVGSGAVRPMLPKCCQANMNWLALVWANVSCFTMIKHICCERPRLWVMEPCVLGVAKWLLQVLRPIQHLTS